MNLTTALKRFEDVDEQTLEEVFVDDSLRGEFIILSAGDAAFLQVGGEGEGPFLLEFKEGGEQFQAVGEVTKQKVKETFLDYLRGGSAWRSKWTWKKLEQRKGCLKPVAIWLLLLGVALWLLAA